MKSIIIKVTLLLIFICVVLAMPQPAIASGTFRATAGVNVRESASASAGLVTTVSLGDAVDVLEHDPAGWSKVQVGSKTGYIRSDFLKLSVSGTSAAMQTTAGVHVRSSASVQSNNSLTSVSAGTTVEVLEHDPAGWSKVQAGGVTGYIRSDFLKRPGSASAGGDASASAGISAGQLKTTGIVNLRSGASTTSGIIKEVPKDTTVDVIANESNGWSQVSYGGSTGYIRSDLLAPASPPASSSQTETQTLYTVGNVNFRKSPSTSAGTFIKTLAKGTAVEVIEKGADGWSKVMLSGTEGYIKSDLLTTSQTGESQTRYTAGSDVRIRAKASTSSSIVRTLPKKGTAVTVLADESNGWSSVTHEGTPGYIKTELLSASQAAASDQVVGMMRVGDPAGANVRSGPGTSYEKIMSALPFGTSVDVLAHESNGWSRVRYNGKTGYIKTSLLISGASVELVTMSEVTNLLPVRKNIRLVDVRTGVSFNIQIFSKGQHADFDYSTREDIEAMFSTRGGVRSWSARPVWVYVGDRVFAASTHGMPHDVNFINNGVNGHFCLHFKDTVTNSKSYQADLRASVLEAYDKRPR